MGMFNLTKFSEEKKIRKKNLFENSLASTFLDELENVQSKPKLMLTRTHSKVRLTFFSQ